MHFSSSSFVSTFLMITILSQTKFEAKIQLFPLYWFLSHNINDFLSLLSLKLRSDTFLHCRVAEIVQNDQHLMPQKGSESHPKWGLTHSLFIGLSQTDFVAVSANILTNLMTKEGWNTLGAPSFCLLEGKRLLYIYLSDCAVTHTDNVYTLLYCIYRESIRSINGERSRC